jgi:hypothetical protein
MVQYLANKRRISFDEMWHQLLVGEYQPLTPDETKALDNIEED